MRRADHVCAPHACGLSRQRALRGRAGIPRPRTPPRYALSEPLHHHFPIRAETQVIAPSRRSCASRAHPQQRASGREPCLAPARLIDASHSEAASQPCARDGTHSVVIAQRTPGAGPDLRARAYQTMWPEPSARAFEIVGAAESHTAGESLWVLASRGKAPLRWVRAPAACGQTCHLWNRLARGWGHAGGAHGLAGCGAHYRESRGGL